MESQEAVVPSAVCIKSLRPLLCCHQTYLGWTDERVIAFRREGSFWKKSQWGDGGERVFCFVFTVSPLVIASWHFLLQGFLLHSKTTSPDKTVNWQTTCPRKGVETKSCTVGIPSGELLGSDSTEDEGASAKVSSLFEPNCYRHSRVMHEWIPKLEEALTRSFQNRQLSTFGSRILELN